MGPLLALSLVDEGETFLVCLVPRACAWFASRLCLHRATGLVPGSVEMNRSKTHGFSLLSLANQ